MTTETTMSQSREFDTLQEAFNAAAEAAMTSFGLPVSGILYIQGGRRFISTGLPTKILLSLARRQSASKKEDPTTTRNRPLDQGHVREIAEYLRGQPEYLVPPLFSMWRNRFRRSCTGVQRPRGRACLCCHLRSTCM
jgi:DndB-like DNA-sulfur modification-associated protein